MKHLCIWSIHPSRRLYESYSTFLRNAFFTVRFLRWYKISCWGIPRNWDLRKQNLQLFYTIMDLPWSPITEIQRLCNNEFNGFLPKWMVGIRLFDDCFLLVFFPIFQGRFVFWLVLVGSVLFVTLFFFFGGGYFLKVSNGTDEVSGMKRPRRLDKQPAVAFTKGYKLEVPGNSLWPVCAG